MATDPGACSPIGQRHAPRHSRSVIRHCRGNLLLGPGARSLHKKVRFFTTETRRHEEARILARGAEASDHATHEVSCLPSPWFSVSPCFSVVKNLLACRRCQVPDRECQNSNRGSTNRSTTTRRNTGVPAWPSLKQWSGACHSDRTSRRSLGTQATIRHSGTPHDRLPTPRRSTDH
jgi:hypothetical protein